MPSPLSSGNRRGWKLVSRCVCLWMLLCIPSVLVAAEPVRPNVVLILADDLGYGDLGCYGQQKIATPHLDQLAREGLRFTQFYAGSTVCAPSRSVLMTGLHTGHTSVRGNAGKNNADAQTLRPTDRTLGHLFQQAGYATGMFGKWGLGEIGSTGHPQQMGFDEFFGFLNQHHAHNYYPTFLIHNSERVTLRNVPEKDDANGGGWARERIDYAPDRIMEAASAWLDQQAAQKRPFLLYLPFTLPHANNEATSGTGNGTEVPDLGSYADRDWSAPHKGQAAMIERLDRAVGQLREQLQKHGLDEQTLILFSSDNGPHQEGGNQVDFFDANGPFRGMKRALYEGGIRVPLIAHWPQKITAGTTTDHIAYQGDFFATFCELTGQPVPPGLDSLSLLPTLLGSTDKQVRHPYLYWEFYEQGSRQAVRFGRWKAIRQPMLTGPVQLFDVEQDPVEDRNLADTQPEQVARAVKYLDEAHAPDPRWKVQEQKKAESKQR